MLYLCKSNQSNNKIHRKFSTHIQNHANTIQHKKGFVEWEKKWSFVHWNWFLVYRRVCIVFACCLQDTCTLDISIIYGSDFCLFCCSHFKHNEHWMSSSLSHPVSFMESKSLFWFSAHCLFITISVYVWVHACEFSRFGFIMSVLYL